jgi:hypothetical protein
LHQSPVWAIAAQVTIGLIIADMLAGALGMVGASIATHGEYGAIITSQVLTVISSSLSVALLRSPLWLLGAAGTIALGRHLNGGPQSYHPSPSAAAPPEAVT